MAYINENGIIPNNTSAQSFRQSVENKNLLAEKGSIYIGTGNANTNDGPAITAALAAGDLNTVLQVGEEKTLKYGKLTTDNIDKNNFISPRADTIKVQDNYCSVVQMTQAAYNTAEKDPNTLYIIIN